jgi:hypothetical protein
VVPGRAGGAAGNNRTRQFLAIGGATILSLGLVLWIGTTVFAPKVPPQVVETNNANQQPNLASDYQQRLDLYYQRRGEAERQRQTATGGYLSGATAASAERGGDAIRQAIIRQSIAKYQATGHPCACPYNLMRNGRQCGDRSAYSRPGGASPLCYAGDVSERMVADWRRAHP